MYTYSIAKIVYVCMYVYMEVESRHTLYHYTHYVKAMMEKHENETETKESVGPALHKRKYK